MLGSEEMTLQEIAEILGVTRERIRQIEGAAFKKLRHPKYRRQWTNIVDTVKLLNEQTEDFINSITVKDEGLVQDGEHFYDSDLIDAMGNVELNNFTFVGLPKWKRHLLNGENMG